MNLKLPCAINAMKLAKKEANTPEGEAIASVALETLSIIAYKQPITKLELRMLQRLRYI